LTRVYRVASIDKHLGFGVSVLQRLCKTNIKKNLYFEVKEKVIEESFNGVRVDRKKAKVKVYGLDSTKETRARLIELLHERVQYHKDKFISPLLHHELETLEVDKKGKTQAIYPNHDDQVFSYLMALYVWYDGKDLAENFGIMKNVLKTDEDVEVVDGDIDKEEVYEKIDIVEIDEEPESEERLMQKKFFEDAKRIRTRKEFDDSTYDAEQEQFNNFLMMHKDAKEAYEEKYHVQPTNTQGGINYVKIPDYLFGNVDSDYDIDVEKERQQRLHGNMYDIFTQV
jgi:hypothetical protein